jgi:hypothetical protein
LITYTVEEQVLIGGLAEGELVPVAWVAEV